MSEEFPYLRKSSAYFVGYKHNEDVTLLCLFLPRMSGYPRNFGEAKIRRNF